MRSEFDRRVVPEAVLALVKACQQVAPCYLAGGAALSGAYLSHRLSGDVDLFCREASDVRTIVGELPALARELAIEVTTVRDSGVYVRSVVDFGAHKVELDLVHEAAPRIEALGPPLEGVLIDSFCDLRAAKLTCILSRSEPRDLVDLLFLDRNGFSPERDLALALQKDAGIDPGVLAWLLGQFPVAPLPVMLLPLTSDELLAFRNELRERMKAVAVPST